MKKLTFILLLTGLLWSCQTSQPISYSSYHSHLNITDSVAADSASVAFIAPYKEKLESEMSAIIGFSNQELTKRSVESTLGNFVADLNQEIVAAETGERVDMGAVATGGLRTVLPKGDITLGKAYEVMPFENLMVILALDGDLMQQLFEYIGQAKNIALSNSKLVYDSNGKLLEASIGGEPFDPMKTYHLAITDYLANGGDRMSFLIDAPRVRETNLLQRDAIIKKIKQLQAANQPIVANIEGRVIFK